MATVNFYIGCNDKDTHRQIHNTDDYKFLIMDIMCNYYDSYSISLIDGVYKDEIEHTFKVSVMFEDVNKLDSDLTFELVNELKKRLNQESILVEMIQSVIAFG